MKVSLDSIARRVLKKKSTLPEALAQVAAEKFRARFDDAAIEAAYKCKYKPAIQNGRPVAVWVSYQVEFVLEEAN